MGALGGDYPQTVVLERVALAKDAGDRRSEGGDAALSVEEAASRLAAPLDVYMVAVAVRRVVVMNTDLAVDAELPCSVKSSQMPAVVIPAEAVFAFGQAALWWQKKSRAPGGRSR